MRKGTTPAKRDRGAVVVETALVLPILLLLLFGIIEFGRLYNLQLTLTHAAREGVREYAVTGSSGQASTAAADAIPGLNTGDLTIVLTDPDGDALGDADFDSCDPANDTGIGTAITMTITYTDFVGFIPLWGDLNDVDVEGTGTMRCGG